MAVQQYHVLKATPAGEPFRTQHGELQGYFLDLEGYDRSTVVMCNRKPTSPPLSGVIWAEAEEGFTKSGKRKLTLRIKPAPDGAQTPYKPVGQAQASIVGQDTITWGQAVIAAALTAKEFDVDGAISQSDVINVAQGYYESRPKQAFEANNDQGDQPPIENYNQPPYEEDDQVDLSEIPF